MEKDMMPLSFLGLCPINATNQSCVKSVALEEHLT